MNAKATWTMIDATGTVRCAQSAALSIPLGFGKTLRYRPKAQGPGITWVPSGAGDCHDIALQGISLTVRRAGDAPPDADDQCNPAGHSVRPRADWQLVAGRRALPAARAEGALLAQDAAALCAPGRAAARRLGLGRARAPLPARCA